MNTTTERKVYLVNDEYFRWRDPGDHKLEVHVNAIRKETSHYYFFAKSDFVGNYNNRISKARYDNMGLADSEAEAWDKAEARCERMVEEARTALDKAQRCLVAVKRARWETNS